LRSGVRVYRREERLERNDALQAQRAALLQCERSGKLTFRSAAAARREAIAVKARGRYEGPVMDVYQCRWCGDWHMTSQVAK
jgi:hypothetical protein